LISISEHAVEHPPQRAESSLFWRHDRPEWVGNRPVAYRPNADIVPNVAQDRKWCAPPYSASAGTLPNRLRKIFHRSQAIIPIARSQWADRQPLLSRQLLLLSAASGRALGAGRCARRWRDRLRSTSTIRMVFLTRIALVVLIVQPLLLPKVLPSHRASGLDDYACKASRSLLTVAPCLSLQPMSALGRPRTSPVSPDPRSVQGEFLPPSSFVLQGSFRPDSATGRLTF